MGGAEMPLVRNDLRLLLRTGPAGERVEVPERALGGSQVGGEVFQWIAAVLGLQQEAVVGGTKVALITALPPAASTSGYTGISENGPCNRTAR